MVNTRKKRTNTSGSHKSNSSTKAHHSIAAKKAGNAKTRTKTVKASVSQTNKSIKKVRYAVVGLGHIAQVAVLPAFKHASTNSELVAFVSDDQTKVEELTKKYKVNNFWSYEQFDACLNSGEIDAVYIALPNNMHEEFTVKAAKAGIHVLCEKPMAPEEKACQKMIDAAQKNNVKLMVAYRLHFDEANMTVVDIVNSGKIGTPKSFHSVFTLQVREGNIRTKQAMAGGPLYDIGIYCINAARYIFQDEPIEVVAFSSKSGDKRFEEIEEMCSVIMRFTEDRLATFTCAFGSSPVSRYQVVGSKGNVSVDPSYEYVDALKYKLTIDGKTKEKTIPKHDQFAAELIHFSQSVLDDTETLASGQEGLADIHIINAIQRSLKLGAAVKVNPLPPPRRPNKETIITRPPVQKPELVKVKSGSRK